MKTTSVSAFGGNVWLLAGVALVFLIVSAAFADVPLVTSSYDERNWSMVYNSQQNEYLAGFTQNGTPLVQRIPPTGSPTGSPAAPWMSPGFIGAGEIQLAYNPHLNQYLVVMPGVAPYPYPSGPVTPMVFAAVIDANAALVSLPVVLTLGTTASSYPASPHLQNRHYRTINAAFNSLANEYLVTYQMAGGSSYAVYSQRVSESGALLGSPNVVAGSGGLPGSHAIAYGPVISPETPAGRYLLVNFDPYAPETLTMLGSAGEVVTNAIPFDWGSPSGNELCPDAVYAEIPGHTPNKVFLVVWEDENNKDYWNPTMQLTGVWGGYVDATKLAYANWATPDFKAFFLSGSCWQMFDGWDPRIAYDPSTLMFQLAARQTPTNGGSCPSPLNYHISLTSFSGTKLAYLVYPAGYGPSPVISQMTGAYPGNELPRHPTIAVGGSGGLLVAWDDARNSSAGNQRDLYGTTVVNDACNGAIVLTENVYFSQNTTNATDDGYSTCLGRVRTKGVWFTYTPTQTGTAMVDTCPSDFDDNIEIFTGTCDALTSIGCNEDSSACSGYWQASCTFACTAGTTYFIYAGGYNGQSGNLQIRARVLSGVPGNDLCSGAIALTENVYFSESTTNATDDGDSPCLGRRRTKGVWFTYTPTQTGTAMVDTCPSDFDNNIEIFTGTCGALTSIGCNEDSFACIGYYQAAFSFLCTAGTTYYVYAGGYNGQSGNLQIRARVLSGIPGNDLCSGAIALSENVYFSENTTNATDDGDSPCLGRTRTKGVWFTYVPAQTGIARVDTCPSDFDNNIEIFTGTCGALTSIGCNEDSSCSGYWQASLNFPCTAATTYYLYAGGYNGQSGNLQIRARVLSAPRRPQLVLRLGSGNLLLTIYGDVDHVHQVQENTSLNVPAGWTTVRSVTLSSDPQTLVLPLPTSMTFWRVVAQ